MPVQKKFGNLLKAPRIYICQFGLEDPFGETCVGCFWLFHEFLFCSTWCIKRLYVLAKVTLSVFFFFFYFCLQIAVLLDYFRAVQTTLVFSFLLDFFPNISL